MLLAVTMLPVAGLQAAYADEPAAEVVDGGLVYKVADGAVTLVGFEDGAAPEGALVVPETVGDSATVKAVEIAEGQVAEGVTSLALPPTVESVKTEGLAAAFPALTSIEVAGNDGAYSSVAGMLFRSAEGQTSSDGTAFAEDALELVWASPAMVVARIPLECKAIAAGAFVDAAALETVMSFGKMESIAAAEKDEDGNVTKPGAFTDEQIGRLTIVVPGTNYAVTGEGAERVSGSVALSEKTDMLEKRKAWFHHGFDTSQIIMGAPFGEIEGVNAVSEDGKMEDRSLVTPLENGKSHLELTPEEAAEKAARRGEDPEAGLSFSYQASMDLSVRWLGDKTATPARVEIPAYAKVDGVTYQVTQIEPNAFEGAVFLASVAIPEGVTSIGESAFAGCVNLKSVSLPSTLKTIDYAAFKGTALESVDIPDSVRWIGGEAFDEGSVFIGDNESIANDEGGSPEGGVHAYAGAGDIGAWTPAWQTPDQSTTPVLVGVGSGNCEVKHAGYRYVELKDYGYLDTSSDEFLTVSDARLVKGVSYTAPLGTAREGLSHSWYGTSDYWTGDSKVLGYKSDLNIIFTGHQQLGARSDVPCRWAELKDTPEDVDSLRILYQTAEHRGTSDITATQTAKLIGQSAVAPLTYGHTMVPYLPGPGRYALVWSVGSLISYKVTYDSTCSTASGLRERFTVEDSDKHLVDPVRKGYRFVGWTGPGNPTTPKKGSEFDIDIAGVAGEELAYTAHWEPKRFNVTYAANGGTWASGSAPTGEQYAYGEGTALAPSSSITREGYWFMGWTPAKEPTTPVGEWYTTELPEVAKQAGTEWYGDVSLTAVWKPKTYALTYDISKAADDSISIKPGETKTFVHPSAITDIQGLSYDEASLADCREGNRHIDLSAIGEAHKAEYLDMDLATLSGEPAGYEFHGWVKPDYVAGTSPDGDATWGAGEEGWHAFTKDVVDALWAAQDDASTNDPTTNEATVYGVYKALGTTAIELRANGPVGAPDAGTTDPDGKQLEWASGSSDALSAQSIFYWPRKGLVDTAAGQTSETGYVDGAGQNLSTWDVNGSTNAAGIDREMLKRYGYRFLGWGVQGATRADDVTYIAYNEDDGQLTLTEAGQKLVKDGWNGGAAVKPVTWDALWEVRTYEITLRLPAPAVKEVSLAPEEEARESYQWWETTDDANSSWYTAVKEWSYWDKFTVPGYQLRSGFNTYEGWYRDSDHQGNVVITHDQGKNGSDPMIGSGDAIFRVSPDKLPAGPTGGSMAETDSGLEAPDGAVTLWMCYTPIYIDVTAPIGVFLAENDAYVVGSDKRTDLETAAKFTVKGGTHDLVLTGVTATDVVSGEVGAGETKDGITTYPVANLAVKGDEAAGGKPGLCEQMFKIYNPSEHGDTRFGKLGSRIFWVSPKGTVTPEGATHDQMTGTKDTGSRRYFGFASGIDNTLADNQKDEGDALDGFKLKKDATAADAKGGLEVIGTETAADGSVLSKTYRFYYGLDLRKTDFNLGAIQAMVEGDDAWQYNTAYKKPLVKVMFTFAVEQVPMVAYSARFGETVEDGAGVRDNGGESVTEEIVVG